MEIRDWIHEAAGGDFTPAKQGLALVRLLTGDNWSIEHEDGWFYFLAGDQWLFRSDSQPEFDALVAGFAVAITTDPHGPRPALG